MQTLPSPTTFTGSPKSRKSVRHNVKNTKKENEKILDFRLKTFRLRSYISGEMKVFVSAAAFAANVDFFSFKNLTISQKSGSSLTARYVSQNNLL